MRSRQRSEAASGIARARSGLAPLASASRPRFVEALLFDVVYKNPRLVLLDLATFPSSATFTPKARTPSFPSFPPFPCAAPSLPRCGLGLGPTSLAPRSLPAQQEPTFSTAPTWFEHDGRLVRSRLRQPEFKGCPEPADDAVSRARLDLSNPLSPLTFNPLRPNPSCDLQPTFLPRSLLSSRSSSRSFQ